MSKTLWSTAADVRGDIPSDDMPPALMRGPHGVITRIIRKIRVSLND